MKILVLAESLRINETSSGIVSSTFLKALTTNSKNKITCIYNPIFNYKLSWLKNINFIKIDNTPYKKNKFINSIPKLRGLVTYINGIHAHSLFQINKWKQSTNIVLAKNNFDLIITLGSGVEFYPHFAMLEINTTIPWLANFHDPFPLSVYPKPYQIKRSYFLRKQEIFTTKIINKASYVSFPSLYLKELMQSKYQFKDDKSIILPHVGITLDDLPSSEKDKNFKLDKSKFNLLHAGTLLGPRKVESLFVAFNKFIKSNPEKREKSILNILGKVAKENIDLLNEKKSNKNINVILDRISYKKSLKLIKDSNVSIIVEANADFSPFMPGKLADLIFLEKPILALTPKKSETLRILGKNYPYQARINDENEILRVLNLLWNDWKTNKLKDLDFKSHKEYISAEMLNNKINKIFECTL